MFHHLRRPAAGLCLLGSLLAACGGESDEITATTVDTSPATSTTAAPTTTVPDTAAPTTTAVTTVPPTTEPEMLTMPLTGIAVADGSEIPDRPALVVKMPVNPQAMPQMGINDADIIFQTIINDSYTRYLLVFHTNGSDPVGPIRSGRLQDIDIMAAFTNPLYAWSGGNDGVTSAMNRADNDGLIVNLNAAVNGGLYYRMSGRGGAPHNLFTSTPALWERTPDDYEVPEPVFSYLADGEAPAGAAADDIDVKLDSIRSSWTFDAESGRYLHYHLGSEHFSEFDGQVWADNVVVMFMDYRPGADDPGNPYMTSVGTNRAVIFTGGTVREGVWSRDSNTDGWVFYDNLDDRNEIKLAPGRTWVEMPRNDDSKLTYSAAGG